MNGGNTVVIQDEVRRLDPKDVLSIVEREKISFLQIVGDAFGRPDPRRDRSGFVRPLVAVHHPLGRRGAELDIEGTIPRGRAPRHDPRRHGFVRGRRADDPGHDGRQRCHDRNVHARAGNVHRERGPDSNPRARLRGSRVGGDARPRPPRLPRRSREERSHVSRHRRRALLGPGRPRTPARRRHGRDARARLRHDQLRRREDLRRGGRGRPRPSPRRTTRWCAGARASSGARRSWPSCSCATTSRRAADVEQSLLDECAKHIARYKLPKEFIFVDTVVRSPPARPTTAGRRTSLRGICPASQTARSARERIHPAKPGGGRHEVHGVVDGEPQRARSMARKPM